MACNQPNYALGHYPLTYGEETAGESHTHLGKHLVVSNSPETIVAAMNLPVTLYKCQIPIGTTTKRIRIFMWHQNTYGASINFGTIVSTSNSTAATISDIVQDVSATQPPLSSQGICLAKAQLFSTLDSISGTQTIGGTEVFLTNNSISSGYTFGLVREFDITAASSCNLLLRTAAFQGTGIPGSWSQTVHGASSGKPRGWWPHCDFSGDCGTFDVTPTLIPRMKQIVCCREDGPEEMQYAKQDGDEHGKANEGLFGVDLHYNCVVSCDDAGAGNLYVYLLAMNTGSQYFGAAEISAWEDRTDRGVPPLLWANPNNSDDNYNVISLTQDGPLVVLQEEPQLLGVRVANAGGATMPFLLVLSNLSFNISP